VFISPSSGLLDADVIAALLSSLRAMPQLFIFALGPAGPLMNFVTDWRPLLDRLDAAAPQLRELTFRNCTVTLPSLSQLNAGAQLRVLSLRDCCFEGAQDNAAEVLLQWIQSMRHLEQLSVSSCFLPLSSVQRMQLTPPSSLVPSLQRFICEY
jgi:hypothetical protein